MTMEVECESRFTKLEESSKSAHHRSDEIAQTQSESRALALSVNSLACAVSRMQEGQEDISCRLREIELKPGRYTVMGTREGFRDVRREITIAPGASGQTISVTCVEPI